MKLVFDNCVRYNGIENQIAKHAIEIKNMFEENMKQTGFMNWRNDCYEVCLYYCVHLEGIVLFNYLRIKVGYIIIQNDAYHQRTRTSLSRSKYKSIQLKETEKEMRQAAEQAKIYDNSLNLINRTVRKN